MNSSAAWEHQPPKDIHHPRRQRSDSSQRRVAIASVLFETGAQEELSSPRVRRDSTLQPQCSLRRAGIESNFHAVRDDTKPMCHPPMSANSDRPPLETPRSLVCTKTMYAHPRRWLKGSRRFNYPRLVSRDIPLLRRIGASGRHTVKMSRSFSM